MWGLEQNWGSVTRKKVMWKNIMSMFGIILVGAFLRLSPVLSGDFPLNDGGLFFTMVQDLQASNYRLPVYTSYNNARIPYAYPPLAFYVVAFLNGFLHIDLIKLFRFLPVLFSVLTIPIVYLLAREFFDDQVALLATFTFSLFLPSYQWLIMGGGITRSPAFFTGVVTLLMAIKFYKTEKNRFALLGGLSEGVTLLFHLEIAWATLVGAVVLGILKGRRYQILKGALIAFIVAILITMPYWLTMVSRFGGELLWDTLGKGHLFAPNIILEAFTFNTYTQESFFTPFAVFTLLGGIYSLLYGEKSLTLWMIALIFLDPRSLNRSVSIPAAFLSTVGIVYVLSPVFARRSTISLTRSNDFETMIDFNQTHPLFRGVVAISYMVLVFNAYFNPLLDDTLKRISKEDLEAFKWVSQNTSSNVKILVVSCSSAWFVDAVSEWFPALTHRTSVLTVQGKEWFSGSEFAEAEKKWHEIRSCYRGEDAVECLETYSSEQGLDYDVIYISSPGSSWTCSEGENLHILKNQLQSSERYHQMFDQDHVAIFSVKN